MKSIVTCLVILTSYLCNSQSSIKTYESFDELQREVLEDKNDDVTYVINFWATWCNPCVKELPYFVQLNEKYKEGKVEMIYVSLDFPKQLEEKLIPFVDKMGIKEETILFTDGNVNKWIDKISKEWSGAIPITIIQKNGQQKVVLQAVHDYKELESYFLKIYDNEKNLTN